MNDNAQMKRAQERADEKLIGKLLPVSVSDEAREKLRLLLLTGGLDERRITMEITTTVREARKLLLQEEIARIQKEATD